ncbi:hypothetical protein C0991_011651 [Blastosporella zonata]|nr:hypothetical protein C0991_011651 [Blastosporella zonata]
MLKSLSFLLVILPTYVWGSLAAICRNVPGSAGYPTDVQWADLNSTLSGRLASVIPSAQFCKDLPGGACTNAQWSSAVFRNEIPGAMNQVNFESDWDSTPPSLCLRDGTTCGQGNTPLFAVLAESTSDIQAGVKFARAHNLRVAIKASGHDFLGRSTAKDSLLISTHKFKSIAFADSFFVGSVDKGSTITVGSGVSLSEVYTASGAVGKIVVGGTSSTVVAAGGYVQGAGHSLLSPLLGLAADTCLEFQVVLANGTLATVNEAENSDLFWAMRGGGAGSWGVIISATFQTFPTFNAAKSSMTVSASTFEIMGKVITAHARHIFDWDSLEAGQYFYLTAEANVTIDGRTTVGPLMTVTTFFPGASVTLATAALEPFIYEARLLGANVTNIVVIDNINQALISSDDNVGVNEVVGSRLVDASVYLKMPVLVGQTYVDLLEAGAPKYLVIINGWDDTTPISIVRQTERIFRDKQLPILQRLAPPGAGAYSNEADALEVDFQTTFYGPNYNRLTEIKAKYDPEDLFIVKSGVGSERWDTYGLCKV